MRFNREPFSQVRSQFVHHFEGLVFMESVFGMVAKRL